MSMSMSTQVMSRASVAKECYEAHCQPWAEEQVEEESLKKVIFILVSMISFFSHLTLIPCPGY